MSNQVSALSGEAESDDVVVTDAGLHGMITLRGDLTGKPLRAVCASLTGAEMPAPGKVSTNGANAICWMSPDELLVLVPYDTVPQALDRIGDALKGTHHLAANVSDARALMTVNGSYSRDVMAKLAPVDLHPDSFDVGDFRRTRLGQVAAAFWMTDERTIHVICFRSTAQYTIDLLTASAAAGPVDYLGQVSPRVG